MARRPDRGDGSCAPTSPPPVAAVLRAGAGPVLATDLSREPEDRGDPNPRPRPRARRLGRRRPPGRPRPARGAHAHDRAAPERRGLRRPEPRRRPPRPPGVAFAPPAEAGDLYRAARAGARVIGLVDGVFEDRPTVWHKEILLALANGVRVLGAASLGALRAAECDAFGMEGVGAIFAAARAAGSRTTTSVAVAHAPRELDWTPL